MEKAEKMAEMLVRHGGTYLLNHAKRVFHLCGLIAEHEHISYNEDILLFASYFHDISAFPPYKPDGPFDHALESAKVAPDIAGYFGYGNEHIDIIVEAIQYHDKAGMGVHNETRLLRNADGVDYLGYMAVARDFSKQHEDMRKAVATLKKRKEQFYSIIDYPYALELAKPRVEELEAFIEAFEAESFGMY